MASTAINLTLQPKQSLAFQSPATEILYGGAAGGGKSHLMRVASIAWASEIAGLQIYLFRRSSRDLVKNHMEGPRGYRATLAPLVQSGDVEIVEGEIRFWNGSKIYLCHCQYEHDVYNYQGPEIHVLLMDEGTHFTAFQYQFLRSRVRMTGITLPDKYKGMFPRIIVGSNPGNVGHHFFKSSFIDPKPSYEVWRTSKEEGGMLRQFIPALLEDNPVLQLEDPTYRDRLKGLGSPELVRAMEIGDWDIVAGAFFGDVFKRETHVLKPFEIPRHWTKYRGFDWGSREPFCVIWVAVADGEPIKDASGEELYLQRGTLVCYREWYGMQPGRPNVGLQMRNEDIAMGILQRTPKDEKIAFTTTDSLPFQDRGGPKMAEVFAKAGIKLKLGDTARIPGWQQVNSRLQGTSRGPLIVFFDTLVHTIRTLTALLPDPHRFEDVSEKCEDHAPDTVRLICQERPVVRKRTEPIRIKPFAEWTYDDLFRYDRLHSDD